MSSSLKLKLENLKELVKQAQKGDFESFGVLYDIFFPDIFGYFYRRTSHKASAEDLSEEVFVTAFQSVNKLTKPESFVGWLYKIAYNRLVDFYRLRGRVQDTVNIDTVEHSLQVSDDIHLALEQEGSSVLLKKAFLDLPEIYRTVLEMRFLEELDVATVAEALGKSHGAIRVIQLRALVKLKIILKNSNVGKDEF